MELQEHGRRGMPAEVQFGCMGRIRVVARVTVVTLPVRVCAPTLFLAEGGCRDVRGHASDVGPTFLNPWEGYGSDCGRGAAATGSSVAAVTRPGRAGAATHGTPSLWPHTWLRSRSSRG